MILIFNMNLETFPKTPKPHGYEKLGSNIRHVKYKL